MQSTKGVYFCIFHLILACTPSFLVLSVKNRSSGGGGGGRGLLNGQNALSVTKVYLSAIPERSAFFKILIIMKCFKYLIK